METDLKAAAGTSGPDCSDFPEETETVRLRKMTNAEVADELRAIHRSFRDSLTLRGAFTLMHAARRLDGSQSAKMCEHTRFTFRCPICNPNTRNQGQTPQGENHE